MKTYTHEPTKHKYLERVVDLNGDWKHYYHKPTKQYLDGVTKILKYGFNKGDRFQNYLLSVSKQEAKQILEETGERGDKVHQYIDLVLQKSGSKRYGSKFTREMALQKKKTKEFVKLDYKEWFCILAWERFWNAHKPILLTNEYSVFDLKWRYGGSLDAILILTSSCDIKMCRCASIKGKIGVWDWKTSQGIRPEYGPQLAAYAKAGSLKEILLNQKVEYTANLRIGTNHSTTNGYELKIYSQKETDENYRGFLAAKLICEYHLPPFNPDKEIKEIPETINIQVKRKKIVRKKVAQKQKNN